MQSVNSLFKTYLIVVLSVFASTNLSANATFFSIEKSSSEIVFSKLDDAFSQLDKTSIIVGVGEIKIVFTAGNYIKSAIIVSDLIGGSAGLLVNVLNESAISPSTRYKLQMLSIVASLPQLARSIKGVDNLITAIDNDINALANINSKVRVKDYFSKIKLKVLAEAVGKSKIIAKLNNLVGDFTHAKNFVNSLDDVADASLLAKLDNLPNAKLQKVDDYYKSLDHPSGFGGQMDYTTTKVIEGQSVSMTYKNGMPDMRSYSPELSFPSGTKKFKYESTNLTGGSADFRNANTALANEFGIFKTNNKWVKNADGFIGNGSYKWKPGTQQFQLKNTNGGWDDYTWHHFEDGQTIFPVKTSIHSKNAGGFPHSGGKSIIIKELQGLFEFLGF